MAQNLPFSPRSFDRFACLMRASFAKINPARLKAQLAWPLVSSLTRLAMSEDAEGLSQAMRSPLAKAASAIALMEMIPSASFSGHYQAIKALLDAGAPASQTLLNGDSALMVAGYHNAESLALTLLPYSDPNYRDRRGRSELARALLQGLPNLARALLEAGADPRSRDCVGMGCLEIAAFCGYPDIARDMLSRGAKLVDPQGRSADALAACAYLGAESGALFLADLGVGLNGSCSDLSLEGSYPYPRSRPVMRQARSDRFDSEFLGSPLHWAAFNGLDDLLNRVLQSASDVDAPTKARPLQCREEPGGARRSARHGNGVFAPTTALALAIASGSERGALALLESGASPALALLSPRKPGSKDSECLSLSELALISRQPALIHPLAQRCALSQEQIDALWLRWPHLSLDPLAPSDYNISKDGRSLLSIACCDYDARALALALVARGADSAGLKDELGEGHDALMHVASIGVDPSIIPFLIESGCDPLRRGPDDERSALHLAALNPRHPGGSPIWPAMFEAIAMAMAPLPGGLMAIHELLNDTFFKDHRFSPEWEGFIHRFLPRLAAFEENLGLAESIQAGDLKPSVRRL